MEIAGGQTVNYHAILRTENRKPHNTSHRFLQQNSDITQADKKEFLILTPPVQEHLSLHKQYLPTSELHFCYESACFCTRFYNESSVTVARNLPDNRWVQVSNLATGTD